jgi:hypothetical protein
LPITTYLDLALPCRSELHAARLQLEAATASVAALPQEMVLMVQGQMRRALREGMVELMREALASPEPYPAAAAAAELVPVMFEEHHEQQDVQQQQMGLGLLGPAAAQQHSRSSSEGEAFVIVDAALSEEGN